MQDYARSVILSEIEALQEMQTRLGTEIEDVVNLLLARSGRLVISGIGKSALIAQKIVATLNSTGTAALFMHAADAIHGDLGLLQKEDTAMLISKSGESPEIKALIPIIKSRGIPLIAMVGNANSALSCNADFRLDISVSKEACPYNLAPSSSTTAQLVMGDALAFCLMRAKNFTPYDFAQHHPGGFLGKQLLLELKDMAAIHKPSSVLPEDNLEQVILAISRGRMGATVVLQDKQAIGIITDGDIRRCLEQKLDIHKTRAKKIMSRNPHTLPANTLAKDALPLIKKWHINQIILQDSQTKTWQGMVHIQDFFHAGFNYD